MVVVSCFRLGQAERAEEQLRFLMIGALFGGSFYSCFIGDPILTSTSELNAQACICATGELSQFKDSIVEYVRSVGY